MASGRRKHLGFADVLADHYPEFRHALDRLEQLDAQQLPRHSPLPDRDERQWSAEGLRAVMRDLIAAWTAEFKKGSSADTEAMCDTLEMAVGRAFLFGVWLGQLGLARMPRPEET